MGTRPPPGNEPRAASTPLNIVLVEDSPPDVELILGELRQSGLAFECRRVDDETAYLESLDPLPDVVIAEYSLARFSGRRALELLRERDPTLPFIVASGTIGDDLAATMMRHGANDYLMKDRLGRLGEAVAHALEEQRLRRRQAEAERALTESEARFRRLAENASDIIFRFRPEPEGHFSGGQGFGTFEYVSRAALSITGYPPETFYADPELALRLVRPGDQPRQLEALAHGTGGRLLALQWQRRDGRMIWTEQRNLAVLEDDGAIAAVEGIVRDVTERKAAEEATTALVRSLRAAEAQRRLLLARLVNAQEEESARIAGDIHDDSIQIMAAVSLRLGLLERRLNDPGQLDLLHGLQESVEICIGRLRRLMFDLRPVGLEQGGLGIVLRERLERSQGETGLNFEVLDHTQGESPADLQVIAFRIAQEALANVRKHAKASKVQVTLDSVDEGLRLRVADDGVGLVPGDEARSPLGHLGLTAMRERAEAAGGWCRVQGRRGEGTTVECWLPLSMGGARDPENLST